MNTLPFAAAAGLLLGACATGPQPSSADRLVYLTDPFAETPDPGFNVTKLIFNWVRLFSSGGDPK